MAVRLLACALCLGGLLGCGGSSAGGTGSGVIYRYQGPGLHGSISLADCTDWHRGPEAERRATIEQLRIFYGGDVGPGSKGGPKVHGPVLGDAQAHDLLQRACSQSFAAGFKLYKLYGRAAGFAGHR